MTTLGRREKCRQNRWGKRHFQALRDRAGQNWPVAVPWEALCTPVRARTCLCASLGLGAMLNQDPKWKSRVNSILIAHFLI